MLLCLLITSVAVGDSFRSWLRDHHHCRYQRILLPDLPKVTSQEYQIDTTWSFCSNASWGGGLYLTVWNAYPYGYYGRRIDSLGTWIDTIPFRITLAPSQFQGFSDLSAHNDIFCLVYEDMRYIDPGLYSSRIDREGNVLDTGILIDPHIHYGIDSYFITWWRNSGGSFASRSIL